MTGSRVFEYWFINCLLVFADQVLYSQIVSPRPGSFAFEVIS